MIYSLQHSLSSISHTNKKCWCRCICFLLLFFANSFSQQCFQYTNSISVATFNATNYFTKSKGAIVLSSSRFSISFKRSTNNNNKSMDSIKYDHVLVISLCLTVKNVLLLSRCSNLLIEKYFMNRKELLHSKMQHTN